MANSEHFFYGKYCHGFWSPQVGRPVLWMCVAHCGNVLHVLDVVGACSTLWGHVGRCGGM